MAAKARSFLRLGAYQGSTAADTFDNNAERTIAVLGEAHQLEVDFACLPECYLTGGCLTSDELQSAAVSVRSSRFREFVRRCRFGNMVAVIGFSEKRGACLHNSAAVIHRGKLIGVHRKSVPGGPHDKEANTFVSDFRPFRLRGVTFGVLICFEGFFIEPALLLAEQGARIIFEPHFSFIPMAGMDWQRQRVRTSRAARAVENDCWYVKANVAIEPRRQVAGVAGLGYGDSFILDNIGRPQAEAGLFTTGWITAEVPKQQLSGPRESRVQLAPPATREQMARLYDPDRCGSRPTRVC